MHESNLAEAVHGIDGLSLLRNAVTAETAERILMALRGEVYARCRHSRRFSRQDFGFEYDISSRGAKPTTPIPPRIRALFPALREAGWHGDDPTQVIVTRYPSGGGLGSHIDAPVFGPEVAGISLGAEWPIHFSRGRHGQQENIPLPVLSAYVMREGARRDWLH
jgi:alkylated DNA repair dioxygenase AlkB